VRNGTFRRAFWCAALGVALVALMPALASARSTHHGDGVLAPNTRFFAPGPEQGAIDQGVQLIKQGRILDALFIGAMEVQPRAVWLVQGTPQDVRNQVKNTIAHANGQHAVPVFVAYNIPGRDCGGLSAGGVATTDAYKAWIDGVAAGVGKNEVVVILEPDGLGLLPSNCGGPNPSYPFTDAQRYEELNYAVDKLEAQPSAMVYLDATHTAWLNVGDAASRLLQAGAQDAHGFFLNVSNYQYSPNLAQYGSWISKCIAYATTVAPGDFGGCPNQYWNGGPLPAKIAVLNGEWVGDALNNYGVWSDTTDVPNLNTSGINLRYANMLGSTAPTTHFVIDTSRNGVGPWNFASAGYANAGVAQDWCNPPGRGLGLRSTANTGTPLLDAYLWIKVPGESDGTCTRGAPAGSVDPEWGIVDPAAGQWFPQQALQLAKLADPPLFH